jgi:nucleolar protein 56
MADATEIVTTWFGAFAVSPTGVVRAYPFPKESGALAKRMALRRAGALAPEEQKLLEELGELPARTRDRRLVGHRVTLGAVASAEIEPAAYGHDPDGLRGLLFTDSSRALAAAFDPSSHVDEAVRAVRDLDGVLNTLRERIASWSARDAPLPDPDDDEAFDRALEASSEEASADPLAPMVPELVDGRRGLAQRYLELRRSRRELEASVEKAVGSFAPNLSALLGPGLAARMIAQAGGLDRLARLPASTVQVLGAERAFFEHLRGKAPPPRHGLLFLHPDIQGAPRRLRGRLARALAGKVAIAARVDRERAPLRPSLAEGFRRRAEEIRRPPKDRPPVRRRENPRPPAPTRPPP